MGVVQNRHVDITIVCHLVIAYLSFQLINAMSSSVKYGGSLVVKIGGGLNSTGCSRLEFRDLMDSYLAFQSTASCSATRCLSSLLAHSTLATSSATWSLHRIVICRSTGRHAKLGNTGTPL